MEIYLDTNGNILKEGDKCILEIVGLGTGEVEIVNKDSELHISDPNQGFYPLKFADKREDIILTIL